MMAAEEPTTYDDLCRLCANKTNLLMSLHIFENEGVLRQIEKKIASCLSIHVHEGDELPNIICGTCVYNIELFYDFKERCIRAENLLVDVYKNIRNPKDETDHDILSNSEIDKKNLEDSDDFIMVHQHPLLNAASLQNVDDLDLSHLENRDNMMNEHEIILSQQNVDIGPHSLANIDLVHSELSSQDLSNHSLSGQDSLLVHANNDVGYTDDNFRLMEQNHQLLNEQFRIHNGLDVGLNDDGNDVNVYVSATSENFIQQNSNSSESQEDKLSIKEDMLSEMPDNNSPQSVGGTLNNFASTENTDDENNIVLNSSLGDTEMIKSDHAFLVPNHNQNSGIEWFCNLCGKGFAEKEEFQLHYEDHFHKCPECLTFFTSVETLNTHKETMHQIKQLNPEPPKTRLKRATVPVKNELNGIKEESQSDSETCNGTTTESENSREKSNSAASKRQKWSPKVCKECGKSYKTNYKLAEHMRKHTGEKPYKCGSCEKAFRSKIGLAQHEAKHTGQYDLSCPTCGKGFQCKSYLMVHQRVHSDVKPYPCTTCGRNFKTKQSLLDHTNRHLGVKPYICDVCGRGFITKGLCKAHQKIHTGLDNRKFSCKICSKLFVSKSYLQTHLRIHTGEKPFICEVCGKGFLTRVDLRIHLTMHTGEKSYVCEMCGKAFARRDALRCHRRSHTGERPYSCDQCGQTFTQFSPMAIHKRLHTGERPYPCQVCGKAFVSRSTMMCHYKKKCFTEAS